MGKLPSDESLLRVQKLVETYCKKSGTTTRAAERERERKERPS